MTVVCALRFVLCSVRRTRRFLTDTTLFRSLVVGIALLSAGCGATTAGPEVLYSYVAPAGAGARPLVYVAAVSDSLNNQPVAMTVLDPVSGQALDTFPLTAAGTHPCGLQAASTAGGPVRFGALDDRYIPFSRWEAAARGQGMPYRVRIYFRSDRGVIWEAEVMARYSGCTTK